MVLCATAVIAERNVPEELLTKRDSDNIAKSHVSKRATVSNENRLWPNGTVYYTYDLGDLDDITKENVENNLETAMKTWSNKVNCLNFKYVSGKDNSKNFVKFTITNSCDSEVGYQEKAGQLTKLTEKCANESGFLLRLIGHVLGLWPEITRPDRDDYVTVIPGYILADRKNNFTIRKDYEIDYQGIEYDYSSIMHYNEREFVKCDDDCIAFNVSDDRYMNQTLGNKSAIAPSENDITRVKRMYKCSGNGSEGILVVNISRLEEDEYVVVKAIDANGQEYTMDTTSMDDRENATASDEHSLRFCFKEWQFFRIRVWNKITSESTAMSETVPILPENVLQTSQHCINTPPRGFPCAKYLNYSYDLSIIPRSYLLKITLTFVRCDCICRGIKINPFVKIKAHHSTGLVKNIIEFNTTDEQTISFESFEIWKKFSVSVWNNEKLSRCHTFDIYPSIINRISADNIRLKVYGGYIKIDYEVTGC